MPMSIGTVAHANVHTLPDTLLPTLEIPPKTEIKMLLLFLFFLFFFLF